MEELGWSLDQLILGILFIVVMGVLVYELSTKNTK